MLLCHFGHNCSKLFIDVVDLLHFKLILEARIHIIPEVPKSSKEGLICRINFRHRDASKIWGCYLELLEHWLYWLQDGHGQRLLYLTELWQGFIRLVMMYLSGGRYLFLRRSTFLVLKDSQLFFGSGDIKDFLLLPTPLFEQG